MQINVQVEKSSAVLRKLTVKVPASEVAIRFNQGLAEVQRTAKIKGFRPGHVPMAVVKQYYGEDVRHQVFHNIIDDSFREAVRKENIRAVGRPKIETPNHKTGTGEHDHTIAEDQDLTYTATVEVLPEIEVKNYKGLSATRLPVEVTDKDITTVVNGLLDAQSELVVAGEGPVKKGDHADLNFAGGLVTDSGIEEKPGMKGSRVIEIGSDTLIPGFEEQVEGMKKGETKTFRIAFPKDYFDKDYASKEAEFTVTVNEIKQKKLPDLNDEFAKTMGYENVADMRKKAEEHLTREKTQESDRKVRSDLLAALIEKNNFDCPESLIRAQTNALAQDAVENLKRQGFSEQMINDALQTEFEGLKKRAETQVRASLLLEAVAKKENLSVTADTREAEYKKMAEQMRVDEAQIRDFYAGNAQRAEDLEYRLKEEVAVRFLMDSAKIK
ncbi:MAG: trigger factor [Bdellovibrionales bacterium]|nr:trigger factor [Bdellovibrionales bacterium]